MLCSSIWPAVSVCERSFSVTFFLSLTIYVQGCDIIRFQALKPVCSHIPAHFTLCIAGAIVYFFTPWTERHSLHASSARNTYVIHTVKCYPTGLMCRLMDPGRSLWISSIGLVFFSLTWICTFSLFIVWFVQRLFPLTCWYWFFLFFLLSEKWIVLLY